MSLNDVIENLKNIDESDAPIIDRIAKAIVNHDLEKIKSIVEKHNEGTYFDLNLSTYDECNMICGMSLLELAIRVNDLNIVKYLNEECYPAPSVRFEEVVEYNTTLHPLQLSMELGYNDISKYLFAGASKDNFIDDFDQFEAIEYCKDEELLNSFITIFKQQHSKFVELLLKYNVC